VFVQPELRSSSISSAIPGELGSFREGKGTAEGAGSRESARQRGTKWRAVWRSGKRSSARSRRRADLDAATEPRGRTERDRTAAKSEQTAELEADFAPSARSRATDEADARPPAAGAREGTSPRSREGSRSRPTPGSHADTPPLAPRHGSPGARALDHHRPAVWWRRRFGDRTVNGIASANL